MATALSYQKQVRSKENVNTFISSCIEMSREHSYVLRLYVYLYVVRMAILSDARLVIAVQVNGSEIN